MIKRVIQAPSIDWPGKFRTRRELSAAPMLQAFYDKALPVPETALEEIEFLALDFETTGLDPVNDDIITIGMVPFTLNRIFINRAQHWTVRPRRQLLEESVVIHGITHNDVMNAPDFVDVIPEILDAMSGRIVAVHYHKIEREFLSRALKDSVNESIEFPVIDTMDLETRIQAKASGGFLNWLKGKKPGSVRLGQSRRRYGLPAYTPHHALTDAIATAELLQAQIAYHYDGKQPVRDFWL